MDVHASACEAKLSRQMYAVKQIASPYAIVALCLPTVCSAPGVKLHPLITGIFKLRHLVPGDFPQLKRKQVDIVVVSTFVREACLGGSCFALYPQLRRSVGASTAWPTFRQPLDARLRCGLSGSVRRHVPPKRTRQCQEHTPIRRLERFRLPKLLGAGAPRAGAGSSAGAAAATPPELFVAVLCASSEANFRGAVRSSWGKHRYYGTARFEYKFFIGSSGLAPAVAASLQREQDTFGDVALVDLVDSYANLTLKFLFALAYSREVVRPRYLLRLNINNRVQPLRVLRFIRSHPEEEVNALYPNGFLWGGRGCLSPHMFQEMSCGTLPLEFVPELMVDASLIPYPQGNWLASSRAAALMWATVERLAPAGVRLPDGFCEDCFVGYLAAASGVPLLDITSDGQRLWYGDNCSRGLTLFDETAEQLAQPRPGCL
eukprot:TRINITY_DN26605_c0_g1_i1.p1 TRINITY_DN26605_c0_g1~~TRINITY_DN26605_c0_g1_i1.p1  ORF type:complete len:483 (-),score=92.01 TRINITY_DN26605_c0_g1_i1:135-1427(-)